MRIGLVILTMAAFASVAASQNLDTLSYGPADVTITGVVVARTFPGSPNFESIKKGDKPEVFWILNLPKPVSVRGVPNDDIDIAETKISRIQLVFEKPKLYHTYRTLLNRAVKVTGTLLHAMSGHHHTAVLLTVSKMTGA